ncbi:MAG: ABC transporter permease subunit [Desulfobacteraceae bacterium]|nr:ABC transporter permease subunit [Desulfobacteraceae bacterium]
MDAEPLTTFIAGRLPELWLRTGEHLMLTGCSSGAAMLIGIPIGMLVFRKSWLRNPAMGAIGILQTIPSLAMLAFLLALLHRIGALPAIIALTIYALLPIVRNTLTGLEGVSPQVMEAAKGIGMTHGQQLRMVRIPLAAPVIVAGIRTAAVVGVGIATLSAFIGAGGLGQFINRGLALSNTRLILLGAVPAALLALVIDFTIGAFEWGLRPERKRGNKGPVQAMIRLTARFMPILLILAGMFVYFTGPYAQKRQTSSAPRTGTVIIGTKNFTEQLILGELMAQIIEGQTGLTVERRFNLGGTMICHGALVNGEIDLYAEYTGTGLTAILKEPVISDPEKALHHVRKAYHERFSARWLQPFGFNNTYAMTVRKNDAVQRQWHTISDLEDTASQLRAGFTAEFAERPDGYPGLSRVYDLEFLEVKDLDPAIMYQAIANREVDLICAFATDGRIAAHDLTPLKDNRGFFPPYQAAPVVRQQCLTAHPEVGNALSLLGGILDNAAMQRLNFEVDGKKMSPAHVAGGFLKAKLKTGDTHRQRPSAKWGT